ncbi:hypothetical protein niasHS_003977 [Heterodera schachtii]|uniref:BING4 C-terminal domain-containing protein n=1 Tax=Heterodera schachtii TaxID=97005 RepID=A0ABD2K3R9_HETSC
MPSDDEKVPINGVRSSSKKTGNKRRNTTRDVRPGKKGWKKRPNGGKGRPNTFRARRADTFPKDVVVPEERLRELDTGVSLLQPARAKTKEGKKRLAKRKSRFIERIERTARAELLLNDQQQKGFIEPDDGLPTHSVRQTDICEAVDVASATKHFVLDLPRFGPYRFNYTTNGRHILLGGRKGHVSAFDWMTKELKSEVNVMESVRDVQWLHVDTLFAVAQKRWLRIYDTAGTELHCVKALFDIRRLDFLPRHFLLVATSNTSFLHWLDVSVGKLVASFPTGHGSVDVLAQNSANAIILTGDSRGILSMWSPNSKQPLVEMFTHKGSVLGIAVDQQRGHLMATTGLDRRLRVWDLRMYKELCTYAASYTDFSHLAFSQTNCLSVAAEDVVQIFNDVHLGAVSAPYLTHRCRGLITDLQFCPFEDVLGVGHERGFVNILVPGSADANIDALRANPFESNKQRKEREVRMLLDKIQPELITLNPADINRVNRKGLKETIDYKTNVMHIKPTDIADAEQ